MTHTGTHRICDSIMLPFPTSHYNLQEKVLTNKGHWPKLQPSKGGLYRAGKHSLPVLAFIFHFQKFLREPMLTQVNFIAAVLNVYVITSLGDKQPVHRSPKTIRKHR